MSSQLETSETPVSDPRAKLIKLLDALREVDDDYAEKRGAILAEMSGVLGGGDGIGAKLKRLKAAYSDLWQTTYREGPYNFDHRIDTGHLKRFLLHHAEDVITARMVSYFKDRAPFYVAHRHPFNLFVRGFNSFVGIAAPVEDHSASATSDKMRGLRGE